MHISGSCFTLSQRNVAPSIEECCIEACHDLCRELCQEDAVLLGDKMKSSVNQKCCFLLFMLAIKTCNIEANTTLSFEHGATGQN